MRLPYCPWKQAWHDQQVAERFFQDMTKIEKGPARQLEASGQWMSELVIEMGQLAQNMVHLEEADPHTPQIRLAYERAVKLSALAALLAGALDQAAASRLKERAGPATGFDRRVAAAVQTATQQAEAGGMAQSAGAAPPEGEEAPMRQTIRSLAHRGISVSEIEIVTGQPRHVIESVLGGR